MAEGAELFKDFSAGGGGSYFRANSGDMFVGEFKGCADAGESSYEGKVSKGVWWKFDLYRMSNPSERVRYVPEDGPDKGKEIDATADGRTSTETGPKSKARAWFSALLQREIPNDADKNAIYAEAIGKRALLVFGPSESDASKVVVKQVLPFKGMS